VFTKISRLVNTVFIHEILSSLKKQQLIANVQNAQLRYEDFGRLQLVALPDLTGLTTNHDFCVRMTDPARLVKTACFLPRGKIAAGVQYLKPFQFCKQQKPLQAVQILTSNVITGKTMSSFAVKYFASCTQD